MSIVINKIKNTRKYDVANKGSAVVITKDSILSKAASGLTILATSATVKGDIIGISAESIVAADARTDVNYLVKDYNDTFIIATTNNSDAAHNGQLMVLTDANTANNTGTTSASGVVEQIRPFGAAADKLIEVKFVA